jgi:hypothetical protein
MKTIASTLCLYLFITSGLFAFPMRDMIGRWSYQNRATQRDGEVFSTRGNIRVTRTGSGDFVFRESNVSGDSIARYTMFRDGRFTLTQGPVVSASGRWRRTPDAILVSGSITTPLGTNPFTASYTMPNENRLVIVQRVPDFETVSRWTARRTRP